MKRPPTLLLIILPLGLNAAHAGTGVSDLSLDQCKLAKVNARLAYESIKNAGAIAEQSLPILRTIQQLNAKARIPDKPLMQQLSAEDVAKYAELTQRLRSTQLSQLMESRRQRDLTVIQKMVVLADRDYRWNDHPRENDPDYFLYASLQLLRVMTKKDDITVPPSPTCSLEFALHLIENEAIRKRNALDVAGGLASLKAILAKYNMEKIDRSRLSKSDLQKMNELQNNILDPAEHHTSFIRDMENIKLMSRASEIMYEANKQDIAFGGGYIDAIGQTIQRRIQNNELDDDTKLAIGLWTKINEKIPSEVVQDWEKFSKQLEELEAGKRGRATKR